ncbi:hypothetical protein [Phaeodactylibacter xiamenensis]|jgi:hypothetical protein|uniref:hypothetical protein n=1 Tax=Phaeodactylibacter xiamenensis TaxID=1524460 RepID=UPI003BABCA76
MLVSKFPNTAIQSALWIVGKWGIEEKAGKGEYDEAIIKYSDWDQWFVNFFSFAYNKNIKAISFINEDWTQLNIEGISTWQDSRLQNNPQVANA